MNRGGVFTMYQIDFLHPVKVHFIGIGGISMSGLAEILKSRGFSVSGSDASRSPVTEALEQKGIPVLYRQRAVNITEDTHLVVYTAAIHPDNPEYQRALELGIPMLTRAELLGQIMNNYRHAVNVAGTHGKTTTTSMISQILLTADYDPTISVGGILPAIGSNIRIGGSDYFVAEACEYTNSFLSFQPTLSIILNIDAVHLDFFKDLDDIRSSFRRFALLRPETGALVINADIPHFEEITRDLRCQVITYSLGKAADYTAGNLTTDKYGHTTFSVSAFGQSLGSFYLKVPGRHNVSNALAAIAACRLLDVPAEVICRGLSTFTGAKRRFDFKGQIGQITVIDDYAHHPTEIEATLKATSQIPHRKLWCVFQPHTYTRTKALMNEFAQVLSAADHVILAKIYPARETDDLGISSEDLKARISDLGTPCECFGTFDEIETWLLSHCEDGDIILTMGAGDIYKVGDHLLGRG